MAGGNKQQEFQNYTIEMAGRNKQEKFQNCSMKGQAAINRRSSRTIQ